MKAAVTCRRRQPKVACRKSLKEAAGQRQPPRMLPKKARALQVARATMRLHSEAVRAMTESLTNAVIALEPRWRETRCCQPALTPGEQMSLLWVQGAKWQLSMQSNKMQHSTSNLPSQRRREHSKQCAAAHQCRINSYLRLCK